MDKCQDYRQLFNMITVQYKFKKQDLSSLVVFQTLQEAWWSLTDGDELNNFQQRVKQDGELHFYDKFFQETSSLWGKETPQNIGRTKELFDEFKRQQNQIPVAGALVLNRDMTKVLLSGFPADHGTAVLFSLPRGKQNPKESLPETAIREVREETGLDISSTLSQYEFITVPRPGNKSDVTFFITVSDFTGNENLKPPESAYQARLQTGRSNKECLALRWVELHRLQQYMHLNINEDAFTCLLRWAQEKILNPQSNAENNDRISIRQKDNSRLALTTVIKRFVPVCAGLLSCVFPPVPSKRLEGSYISFCPPQQSHNYIPNHGWSGECNHNMDDQQQQLLTSPKKRKNSGTKTKGNNSGNHNINNNNSNNNANLDASPPKFTTTQPLFAPQEITLHSSINSTTTAILPAPSPEPNVVLSVDALFAETPTPTPAVTNNININISPAAEQKQDLDVDALFSSPIPAPEPSARSVSHTVTPSMASYASQQPNRMASMAGQPLLPSAASQYGQLRLATQTAGLTAQLQQQQQPQPSLYSGATGLPYGSYTPTTTLQHSASLQSPGYALPLNKSPSTPAKLDGLKNKMKAAQPPPAVWVPSQ